MTEPDEIVEVAGQPHTFGLVNTRHLLRKLEWELIELRRQDMHTVYRAFNTALTAWHLTDWVWNDLPDDRRREWRKPSEFKRWCQAGCPELRLCRLVANASKHMHRDRAPAGPIVITKTFAHVVRAKYGISTFGEPFATWTWQLVIREGDQESSAVEVFARVLAFWQDLIAQDGMTA